jgi:hypothetical protein
MNTLEATHYPFDSPENNIQVLKNVKKYEKMSRQKHIHKAIRQNTAEEGLATFTIFCFEVSPHTHRVSRSVPGPGP